MPETLYRRPLPPHAIAFSSAEGRALFAEALAAGGLDGYFPLAEQFHTQSDPAFCGLGSLVVALNALGVDPGRLWKGPWRWFAEDLLDCCVPLDDVRARGLDLDELACLARCNGADVTLKRADDASLDAFRADVAAAAEGDGVLIAAYDRASIGQTGAGHFSPIGGIHAARDLVLLLDVARFKYPPHWIAAERVWRAMHPVDPATGRPRGWLRLRARSQGLALGYAIRCASAPCETLAARLAQTIDDAGPGASIARLARALAPLTRDLELRTPAAPAHAAALAEARAALRAVPAYGAVAAEVGAGDAEAVTLLLLLAGDRLDAAALGGGAVAEGALGAELRNVRAQMEALAKRACAETVSR